MAYLAAWYRELVLGRFVVDDPAVPITTVESVVLFQTWRARLDCSKLYLAGVMV